ncbi:MAG: hypothetical protein EOP67_24300 [Sphingomonas sp.]|nr:MAG: hypothetical protein EOP67_24300 [Sphingomonas sp.]
MTEDLRRLLLEVTNFDKLLSELKTVRSLQGHEQGKALVALRRRLPIQLAEIASIVRPLLEPHDIEGKNQFRCLHSSLLSKLALHQANWPAVRVVSFTDNGVDGYNRSSQMVDEAAAALVQWMQCRYAGQE